MNCICIKRIVATVAFAVAISVIPMAGQAQDSEPDAATAHFIEKFDRNGDGLVALDEFPGPVEHFSQLDVNGDGFIAVTEAPRQPPHGGHSGEDLLVEFDSDGDGALSAEEFPGPEDHFARLDSDGDNLLSAAELSAARPGPPPEENRFANDDADQDGLVSQEEFSGPEDLFTRLDADGDGYITRQESRAGHSFAGRRPVPPTGDE